MRIDMFGMRTDVLRDSLEDFFEEHGYDKDVSVGYEINSVGGIVNTYIYYLKYDADENFDGYSIVAKHGFDFYNNNELYRLIYELEVIGKDFYIPVHNDTEDIL